MTDSTWSLGQRFDHQGQEIAYDVMGDGDPIVLVHGTPFSSYVWRKIAIELARTRTVYLYDLPGYGQSEKRPGQDISLGVQNGAFAALLDHWSLKNPDVIAHDFGGATVLRAHLLNNCDYRKLLLFDAVAVRPWGSPFVQHVRENEQAFAGVPDYLQRAILNAYIRTAINRGISDSDLEPYIAQWTGNIGQPAFYRQIAQMDLCYTDEVEDRYKEIKCQTLVLWGVEDKWIPLDQGRKLAAMIPNCEFREIAGSGHLMQEDAPEAILSAALTFFDLC